MSNQYLDIEAFARLSGLSVNTVRRKIKTLSETDKKAYIQYVPIVGRGGQKTMLDKALINHWVINGDSESIIEILRGQIEYLQKQGEVKDTQISDLSHTNKELIERLKEVNYTLATAQKQLSAPVEDKRPGDLKWWQFWK